MIAAAHAYQIGSARDELNTRFHAARDLIARMPNLLIVSTNGAGFDTVNVKDCTDAGVLVVNQTGGNAEAVATHVIAMVLALSKQIIQTNHAMRGGRLHDRLAFMGNDVAGRTIGIVGLGNVGRRIAALAGGLLNMQVIACDPYLDEADDGGARRRQGDARRTAQPGRLRLDQLPARRHHPRHDRRARIRA